MCLWTDHFIQAGFPCFLYNGLLTKCQTGCVNNVCYAAEARSVHGLTEISVPKILNKAEWAKHTNRLGFLCVCFISSQVALFNIRLNPLLCCLPIKVDLRGKKMLRDVHVQGFFSSAKGTAGVRARDPGTNKLKWWETWAQTERERIIIKWIGFFVGITEQCVKINLSIITDNLTRRINKLLNLS